MTIKRTMIFVDGQNLTASAGNAGITIDAIGLREFLSGENDLIRAYWFDSFPTEDQIEAADGDDDLPNLSSKEGFFYFLRMNGYRVEANPLRWRNGSVAEKGADIGLATEMVAQGYADSYDIATVVSGDRDFKRSIRYVQDGGKIVRVAAFERSISSEFKTVADEYVELDDHIDQIEMAEER